MNWHKVVQENSLISTNYLGEESYFINDKKKSGGSTNKTTARLITQSTTNKRVNKDFIFCEKMPDRANSRVQVLQVQE